MNNYLLLIGGYLFIFLALILSYFRLKKTTLDKEDLIYWRKIEKIFGSWRAKFLEIAKISERELFYLWQNFWEKILRRIKISALKIETWANKKLEKMKKQEES
jgi:hypothetical protein